MVSYGTKSGFEIRADLLSQAQGLLEMNAQRELDAAYFAIDQAADEVSLISLPVIEITAEEVIETARQLNAFVNEK
jgi:transaldolase|tara:strand:+ start:3430 stop:3657 length:228 start_codon:yes stop_codon:yes gene_type:complete